MLSKIQITKKILILLLLSIYCFIAFNQYAKADKLPTIATTFSPADIPNLSPMENVSVIYQDRLGVIWLATTDGLISYDTASTKRYIHTESNRFSISNNQVSAITEDNNGHLWLATQNGLNRFDIQQQKFHHYLIRPTSDEAYVNNRVYDVFVDSKNRVWAATASGLHRYNQSKNTFTNFRPWHPEYAYNNLDIWAYTLHEDSEGSIWLGTSAGGIIRFDPKKNHFTHFSSHKNNKNKFPIDFVNVIKVKSQGQLLVGTETGLILFDTRQKTATSILPGEIDEPVTKLEKDQEGAWWMISGTNLLKLSSDFNNVEKRAIVRTQKFTNRQQKITALFIDKEDNIWTSFKELGVHKLSNESQRVQTLNFNPAKKTSNFAKINDVTIHKNKLWLATNQEFVEINLDSLDTTTHLALGGALFPADDNTTNLGSFNAIHSDSKGNVFIARDDGFSKIEPSGIVVHSVNNTKYPTSAIVVDKNDNTWMLAGERGVIIHNDTLKKHPFFAHQTQLIDDNYSTAQYLFISNDRNKVAVFYLDFGLYIYSIDQNKVTRITDIAPSIQLLNIQQNSLGNLILFDRNSHAYEVNFDSLKVKSYRLPIAKVGCIVIDNEGTTWYSQIKGGLYRSPISREVIKLRESEGTTPLGMTGKQCKQTKNGTLLFASYEGVMLIEPNKGFKNKNQVNTIISQVTINNREKSTEIYQHQRLEAISKQHLLALNLNHDEMPIKFNFAALSFTDIPANRFKYRVMGLSDKWTVSQSNEVTLTYLPTGKYEFQVLGSNPDNYWSNLPASVVLHIHPPLWLAWWAKCIYVALLGTLVYLFIFLRTRAIRKKATFLEDMVTQRTQELAKEKEIVEQLLSKKNDEFANVSHEFRTPLTLILGPVQNLLRSNIRSSTRKKLEMARRNGYRLLRMVDQLLNMEKFKVQQIINSQPIAIKPIISLIGQSFKELAEEKNIDLKIVQIDDISIDFTLDAFEKIILNLLSNALKYTATGGEIWLSAIAMSNGQVKITVKDSGIGIPKDKLQSVFERYNRVLDEKSEKITGAGIGLALVKELVEAHKGNIELESELGVGSKFTVFLNQSLEKDVSNGSITVNNEMIELELESIRGQEDTIYHEPANVSTTSLEDVPANESSAEQTTLLIIEDNSDMRSYIIDSLSSQYRCLEASNGKIGVSKAIRNIPDLIISDVMMPEMDGYEVSQILKEDEKTSHIPLILLTARGDKESRMRGWREHADEYLTKPFDSDELNIRVENLLSIRNILRTRFAHEDIENQSPAQLTKAGMNDKDQSFIEKVNECCEQNYTDAEFETAKIAEAVFMSERQFQRKLKALVDRSPSDYLRIYRLNRAKIKLKQGGRISDIALDVGFSSQAYFSKCFKAQFGITAKQYQTSG